MVANLLVQGQPLDLGAHDLNSVTLMIEYLYTSTYQPTPEVGPPDYGLDIHITMFALACTLSIPGKPSPSSSLSHFIELTTPRPQTPRPPLLHLHPPQRHHRPSHLLLRHPPHLHPPPPLLRRAPRATPRRRRDRHFRAP